MKIPHQSWYKSLYGIIVICWLCIMGTSRIFMGGGGGWGRGVWVQLDEISCPLSETHANLWECIIFVHSCIKRGPIFQDFFFYNPDINSWPCPDFSWKKTQTSLEVPWYSGVITRLSGWETGLESHCRPVFLSFSKTLYPHCCSRPRC